LKRAIELAEKKWKIDVKKIASKEADLEPLWENISHI